MSDHTRNILRGWKIDNVLHVKYINNSTKTFHITTYDHKQFILKEKGQNKTEINKEYRLLLDLVEQNIPVSLPIMTPDNEIIVTYEGKNFCLYKNQDGEIYTDHYQGDYENRARLFGDSIGKLHIALRNIEGVEHFDDSNLIKDVFQTCLPTIQTNSYFSNLQKIVSELKDGVNEYKDVLPYQLIHRDLHPGNMLFKDQDLNAFIDFEIAVRGYRIFDVCYCATSILSSEFENQMTRMKWLNVFKSIIQGYSKHIPFTNEELHFMWYMMLLIELTFIAHFVNQRMYSAANQNIQILDWIFNNKTIINKTIGIN